MWIDQRGSEVLGAAECRRLLALAAKEVGYGRLAVSREGAPVVVPVNFTWQDSEVRIRLAEGFLTSVVPGHLVAFEVDMVDEQAESAWSVLARGLAHETDAAEGQGVGDGPQPMVPRPGDRVLAIRPDVVTGRRFPIRRASRGPGPT